MKKKFLFLFLLLSTLIADDLDMKKLKAMKARAIGPGGMSGRVTSIDVVLSNTDIIYVGTASGGLWRSESGGVKWEPIFDDQNAASIGDVVGSVPKPRSIPEPSPKIAPPKESPILKPLEVNLLKASVSIAPIVGVVCVYVEEAP